MLTLTKPDDPPKLPSSDVQKLRDRIDQLVTQIGDDWPSEMLARALVAKACDVSLATKGMPATIWMTQRAEDLLAGHWTRETADLFIETSNR